MVTTAEVMSFLVERSITGLPAKELGSVFDKLVWCMDDNGGEINLERRNWLRSDDKKKVEIALSMSEMFPFDSRNEMLDCFESVKQKWPEFEEICNSFLDDWDEQYPSDS